MDQKLGLAQGQIFMVALLLVMVVIYLVAFIFVIFPYLQEAGNDEITDKNDDETANEDDSEDFYNFKVIIFDSTGNIIKEIKCQDYEYDKDNNVFYFLDEKDKDHYIYIEGKLPM